MSKYLSNRVTPEGETQLLVVKDGKVAHAECPDCGELVPVYTHDGYLTNERAACGQGDCEGWLRLNACDWEDCFSKWGQDDGDGEIYTWAVSDFLTSKGWKTDHDQWGIHNVVIFEVYNREKVCVYRLWAGEDSVNAEAMMNPRSLFPEDLLAELDSNFKPDTHWYSPVIWKEDK